MPTLGQANYIHQNINSLVALLFVASLAAGIALIVWHACIGNNPIADFIAEATMTQHVGE